MKLVELRTDDYIKEMGSDSPAPGGGSASAFSGAQGAALLSMVCRLTLGKKKYADSQEFAQMTLEKAELLQKELTEIIDRDTESFNAVTAVFAMPKETEEEKARRKAAMQEALKLCTVTPMEMMRLSEKGIRLVRESVGKLNQTALSDLGCALFGFRSCLTGAWLNVLINTAGLTDEQYVRGIKEEGQKLLDECLPLADELYAQIMSMI